MHVLPVCILYIHSQGKCNSRTREKINYVGRGSVFYGVSKQSASEHIQLHQRQNVLSSMVVLLYSLNTELPEQ